MLQVTSLCAREAEPPITLTLRQPKGRWPRGAAAENVINDRYDPFTRHPTSSQYRFHIVSPG